MITVPFVKMQAVANDFVLLDERHTGELDWPRVAQILCARPLGIGSDGLLVIGRGRIAPIRMRMWNPDGTEDFCGNGLQCAATYAFEHGWVNQTEFSIETLGATVQVSLRRAVGAPDLNVVESITLNMGQPQLRPEQIPLRGVDRSPALDIPLCLDGRPYAVTALSTGTTHAVIFVERSPADEEFEHYSPILEHHPAFPARTSVLWVTIEDRTHISMRIWERGVGETLGCGTGACAAAVAARLHDRVDTSVTVASRGGELRVEWAEGQPMRLTGRAETVFAGTVNLKV